MHGYEVFERERLVTDCVVCGHLLNIFFDSRGMSALYSSIFGAPRQREYSCAPCTEELKVMGFQNE